VRKRERERELQREVQVNVNCIFRNDLIYLGKEKKKTFFGQSNGTKLFFAFLTKNFFLSQITLLFKSFSSFSENTCVMSQMYRYCF